MQHPTDVNLLPEFCFILSVGEVTKKAVRGGVSDNAATTSPATDGLGAAGMSPRLRVVISCVTFDVVKVVEPIKDLRAERVYLIRWESGGPKIKRSALGEFYTEVCDRLREIGFRDGDIVERKVDVYQFKKVMGELLAIMFMERGLGNDVYINLSAGSMEFVAAATVASMMVDGVKPFTVHSKRYTISNMEKMMELYRVDGKLVGQTVEVDEPTELPSFHISPPPRDLVIGLRVFRKRRENNLSTKYTAMIQDITEAGAWTYDQEKVEDQRAPGTGRGEKVTQAEKMYYSRHYIDGWMKAGWVDGKNGRGRELKITGSGENVTDIFYLDA
jgi:hypothetical protein